MPRSSKPNDTPTSPPPEKSEALQALEAELRAKVQELRSAKPREVHDLTTEIQRLRVLVICTRELDTGIVEPNAYKELALLNKLLAGNSLEGSGEEIERKQQVQTATEKLEKRGISPESAPGIVRALEAITSQPVPEAPDDGEPEPLELIPEPERQSVN